MGWLGEMLHCNFCHLFIYFLNENGSIFYFHYDAKGLVQERLLYVFEIEYDA